MRQTPTMLGKKRLLIGQPRSAARCAAFTIIELLVVVTILMVLVSIIMASLARVRSAAKSFVCKNQLKTVAFEFIQFADDYAHPWRGDSDKRGGAGFSIQDFQERLYGVAEFSKAGAGAVLNEVRDFKAADHPLICPCGPQELQYKINSRWALESAITPIRNISIGFNLRLYKKGPQFNSTLDLNKNIVEHTTVPLAFDVDGEKAQIQANRVPVYPFFSAPQIGTFGPWSYWHPALSRHGGHINAAFIGGHVLSSSDPEKQGAWDWKYQPPS